MPFTYTFPFAFQTIDYYRRPYRLEARDESGNLIAYLQKPFDIRLAHRLNEPSTLDFTIDKGDSASSSLNGANQIWIRGRSDDTKFISSPQNENLLGKFKIQRRIDSNDSGAWVTVQCEDLLGQLADEVVTSYSATDTIANHLTALFALQARSNSLSVGTIDTDISTISLKFEAENDTLLHTLKKLEAAVPRATRFWVNLSNQFNWEDISTTYGGQQLRLRKNVVSVARQEDYTKRATRLYVQGAIGAANRRIKLSDAAGSPPDYVQDTYIAWKYQKQLIVDGTKVEVESGASPYIDGSGGDPFPVKVVLSSDDSLSAHAKSDASDLRFLDASGNSMRYQRDSYTSSTGALTVWVEFDSGGANTDPLSPFADTVFYMLYGNASASDASTSLDTSPVGKSTAWSTTQTTNTGDPSAFYTLGNAVTRPGIVSKLLIEDNIEDADDLLTWANWRLGATAGHPTPTKDPEVTYTINALDLSELSTTADHEALALGDYVHVIDEQLGLDAKKNIVQVTKNLSDPRRVDIAIGTVIKTITDTTRELIEDKQREDAGDEDIAPSQIPIDDTNTLDDWTDGSGFISNDAFQDNSIDSSRINVDGLTGSETLDGWRAAGTDNIDGQEIEQGTLESDQVIMVPSTTTTLANKQWGGTTDLDIASVRHHTSYTLDYWRYGSSELIDGTKIAAGTVTVSASGTDVWHSFGEHGWLNTTS